MGNTTAGSAAGTTAGSAAGTIAAAIPAGPTTAVSDSTLKTGVSGCSDLEQSNLHAEKTYPVYKCK